MQKIPIDKTRYICFDEVNNTAKVVIIAKVQKTLQSAQERLAQLPTEPDEKELLEWARENHPQAMDYSVEKSNLESIISDSKKLLEMGE